MVVSRRNKQQISSWLNHKIIAVFLLSFISCHPRTDTAPENKAFNAVLQEVLITDTLHFSQLSFKIAIENRSGGPEKLIFKKEKSENAPSADPVSGDGNASVILFNPYNTNMAELKLSDTSPNEVLILNGHTAELSFALEGNNTITTYFNLHPSDRSGIALKEMLKNTRLMLRYHDSGGIVDSIEVKMPPSFLVR